jgi:NAD(P)-dependent dehydrogenase (short-subunit alcohol dehydrogenase family)
VTASAEAARPRVFLVTGSSSGIGAATCRLLAAPGTAFLIHARANRAGAEAVAAEVRAKGGLAEVMLGDITEPGAAGKLVQAAVEAFGGLDVVVSNAGHALRTPFVDLAEADVERSVATIQTALFRLAQAAIPHLKAGREPRLVAISSFVAHVFRADVTLFPATAAAKAATEAMIKALAVQLAPHRITANAVAPGFTQKDATGHSALTPEQWAAMTAKVPLGRLGTPADVANVVRFLVQPESNFVTGQIIHVNGGLHI